MALDDPKSGIGRIAGHPFGRPLLVSIRLLFAIESPKAGLVKVRYVVRAEHKSTGYVIFQSRSF